MSLRIQVDARLLNGGGIGRYVRELTGRWLTRSDVDRVRFFGRPVELEPFLAEHDPRGVAEIVAWADVPYSPIAQLRWPSLARAGSWRADISFLPHYDVPIFRHPQPSVVTVHDLIHFQLPEGFPAWKRALGLTLLRGALDRATAVVTVSDTSRHAICEFNPSVVDKVHVVRNGIGSVFQPLSPEERVRAREAWAPLGRFVLCVGPAKAHKNLEHAFRTLAHLPEAEGWRLVMVGPTEDDCGRVLARAGLAALRSRIVLTGRVTDEQLRTLYGLTDAVLVPSVLEGFGLPVLEARACGGTVLAGDLPWARELESSGVTLMKGWSPSAWAEEVRMPSAGTQSTRLSPEAWGWERAAERTFQILKMAREVGDTQGRV